MAEEKDKKYTVGSLFAGIGGICLGFKQAGFQVKWANEYDKNACITYRANFPDHNLIEGDIYKLDPKDFDKIDVITAGFPCQAFSIAGYQKGFKDPRGNLFFEIIRFIDAIKPKAFLLENVKNLVRHDKGNTFKVIEDYIRHSGYSFIPKVLNSMEYGNVPQNRERIYIVGFKDESEYWGEMDRKQKCSSAFRFPNKIELTDKIKKLMFTEKVEPKYYYSNSKYYPELDKFKWSKETVYQWRRVYLRENKSNVCPTLTANMGMGGHNVPLIKDDHDIRKLTPRECGRFQGFPDSFILPEKMGQSQLYKQIGNSVTVPVIKRIAEQIKIALDAKYKKPTAK